MSDMPKDKYGRSIQTFKLPASGSTDTLSITTSSAATSALTAGVYMLVSDVDCFIANGATATTSDMPIKANVPMFWALDANDKIAGIVSTGTATLTFTLC